MTAFQNWNKRVGPAAIFEAPALMSNKEVTLADETIFALVDDGFDDTVFVFKNGRYEASVDDWLDQESNNGHKVMRLSMMTRW